MAEAIDGVGELRRDRRVEVDIGVAGDVDGRDHLARELLEHEVLVLGFGTEFRGLEQALAVEVGSVSRWTDRPAAISSAVSVRLAARLHPAKCEGRIAGIEGRLHLIADIINKPVVLVLEDLVDGGQTDVFIHTPVAGDKVLIEQLSVIGAGRSRPPMTPSASATRGSPNSSKAPPSMPYR